MRWARIVGNSVREVVAADPAGRYHPSMAWAPCPDTVMPGHTYDGAAFSPPEPPKPTAEEARQRILLAIRERLDGFARTRGYDGIMSAATYAASGDGRFRREGRYAVAARDAAWARGYEILNAALAGERPMPSPEEVMAALPALAWPEAEEAGGA